MKLKWKAWLEDDGELVFGPGRARLLRCIDRHGSLSAAAEEMDMSYRHAWSMLRASERRLGRALVERKRGGSGGGGARVTDAGRKLLACFERLETEFHRFAEDKQDETDALLD